MGGVLMELLNVGLFVDLVISGCVCYFVCLVFKSGDVLLYIGVGECCFKNLIWYGLGMLGIVSEIFVNDKNDSVCICLILYI